MKFKLVPEEPTEEMLDVGNNTRDLEWSKGQSGEVIWQRTWKAMLAAAPSPPAKDGMSERELLRNAEIFLRIGADYAPDEPVSDQNKITGEWLKTRGLATTMLRIAGAIKERFAAYEGKEEA